MSSEILTQGSLQLLGAECFGGLREASLSQGFGQHGLLRATVWLLPEAPCDRHSSRWYRLPVSLIPAGREGEPLFSGLATCVRFGQEGGRPLARLEAVSCCSMGRATGLF